ncbi:hypothetical protein [Rhodococcus sp. NPDC076796]|uniref:hypothetical protein n=1 Tax=Rhodococcus sp. NPDC076796 TaxID=3154859 RepID=UPI002AD61CCA|nr:hypothetical protein [Rhodococcus sp. (in: high G+C Gram-positive bacteria)]
MNAGPHPTALITGAAGQDGSYLSELLLECGWANQANEVRSQDVFGAEPASDINEIIVATVQFDTIEEIAA